MSLESAIARLKLSGKRLDPGHVWLVGAGPGDPGCLTLDALSALDQSDALVHDALVSSEVIAIAAAADGTTNALGLSDTTLFAPLYGKKSAARFRVHAERSGVAAVDIVRAGLQNDVDTVADLVSA